MTIWLKGAIAAVLVLSIAGCAVPYARKGTQGFVGGFDDKQLGPGRYAVEIRGNGYTTYEIAEQYFHRRAGELCAGKKYAHTLTRTTTKHTSFYFTGQFAGTTHHVFPVVVGEVTCQEEKTSS